MKVEKCIGFDATEDHRTYATGGDPDLCPAPGLPAYADRYDMRYPLREWGLTREDCGRIIAGAGLPIPPKSACFFCPSAKDAEILQLAATEPDLYRLALEMERLYREGRHFKGDNAFNVSATRKDTKEKVKLILYGEDVAAVRAQFRMIYDDVAQPYRYKVRIEPAVAGLSRSTSWESKRIPLDLVQGGAA